MDELNSIKQPILQELDAFEALFKKSLSHTDPTLSQALEHIRQRGGKRMRPILTLLAAKCYGEVTEKTLYAAVGLELLHTASLVHDDVVDESKERRGQASVNASFNNKVAVLVGDYILSTSLLYVSYTRHPLIIDSLAELGRTLSRGEILQLNNFDDDGLSESVYERIIDQKTASLFATCGEIGALSVDANANQIAAMKHFGRAVGMIFQIRDDVFDYFDNSDIGKPTGNDMKEGKLTLPAIYAVTISDSQHIRDIARKVKNHNAQQSEIDELVAFSKVHGGIEYASKRMGDFHQEALQYLKPLPSNPVTDALRIYLDFMSDRRF